MLSGVAGATPPTITTGSLPNTGTIDCGTFVIAYSGTLSYRETDFYDNAGNFVRAQSKVAVTETDTNTSTGNSIALRSDYTVTDYADGSEAINGTICLKVIGLQQSDDWDRPRGDRTAWRREDTVCSFWSAIRLGTRAIATNRILVERAPNSITGSTI